MQRHNSVAANESATSEGASLSLVRKVLDALQTPHGKMELARRLIVLQRAQRTVHSLELLLLRPSDEEEEHEKAEQKQVLLEQTSETSKEEVERAGSSAGHFGNGHFKNHTNERLKCAEQGAEEETAGRNDMQLFPSLFDQLNVEMLLLQTSLNHLVQFHNFLMVERKHHHQVFILQALTPFPLFFFASHEDN